MPRPDGAILDCITPEEHEREEGGYTVPLYTQDDTALLRQALEALESTLYPQKRQIAAITALRERLEEST
jgi:hypothetical protein